MQVELKMLVWSVLLLLLLVFLQVLALTYKFGLPRMLGNREHFPAVEGWEGRLWRSRANLLENLVPFAIAVLVAGAAGVSNGVTVAAAEVFFGARVLHALVYILGIPLVRTVAWLAGIGAILAIVSQLPLL